MQRSGAPHVLQRRQGTCPIPVGDKTRRTQKRSQGRILAGVGNEAVCDCRDMFALWLLPLRARERAVCDSPQDCKEARGLRGRRAGGLAGKEEVP